MLTKKVKKVPNIQGDRQLFKNGCIQLVLVSKPIKTATTFYYNYRYIMVSVIKTTMLMYYHDFI